MCVVTFLILFYKRHMEEEVASGVRDGVSLNYFNRAKKNFRHLNLIAKNVIIGSHPSEEE